MKKFLIFVALITLMGCGIDGTHLEAPVIVKSVEFNSSDTHKSTYCVTLTEASCGNSGTVKIYTNTKYSVGDTIK